MEPKSISATDRRKELAEEYKLLLARWDDMDRRALSIKGWVSGGMLVALSAEPFRTSIAAPLLAAVVAFLAWTAEAHWRIWQNFSDRRIKLIEKTFRDEDAEIPPFQIHTAFEERDIEMKAKREGLCSWLLAMRGYHTATPYAAFIAINLLLMSLSICRQLPK